MVVCTPQTLSVNRVASKYQQANKKIHLPPDTPPANETVETGRAEAAEKVDNNSKEKKVDK